MAKGTEHDASVFSSNTVEFRFPYAEPQHAKLILRSHPRHGKDVILRIERGQFLCHSYEDCSVLVRFDEGKARSYAAVGPSDNSSETVFIRDYPRFYREMRKAKIARLSTDVYQESAPVFEFDVSGFDPTKYGTP
jgi:hypothetical protein